MWHIPEIILFGKMEGSRKFVLWKTLIVGSIVAAFLIYALVENNLMKGNMYKRSMNIFLVAVLTIDGKKVYQIGIPIHQGYRGIQEDAGRDARTIINRLTPTVADPNAYTPEFKGFMVKVEKA